MKEILIEIDCFLNKQDAEFVFEKFLDYLFSTVIENIERFPLIGTDFMAKNPMSIEGKIRLDDILEINKFVNLREYICGEYLILYTIKNDDVFLLSIKHHRQLSFDLKSFM